MNILKVKDEHGLVRDKETNAILNRDNNALKAYKARKRKMQETDMLVKDVSELKDRMLNIETLLTKLVERENK